jgi:hypothetical protein
MIVTETLKIAIVLDESEWFKTTVIIGNRKKRKGEILVSRVVVYDDDFDMSQPDRFGKVFVRGWYIKQDGERGSIQYSGTLGMAYLPLEVRTVVVSFFWPLIPRERLGLALGVPSIMAGRTTREPRDTPSPARTPGAGGTVSPQPAAARSGQVTSPGKE